MSNKKYRFLVWAWENPEEGDFCTWLGVHVVNWHKHPYQPTMAFNQLPYLTEEEHKTIREIIENAEKREQESTA